MPDDRNPGPGYVRVLAVSEKKGQEWLVGAARAALQGEPWDPAGAFLPTELVLDQSFGAVALGLAAPFDFDFANPPTDKAFFAQTLLPENSVYFAIRAYVKQPIPRKVDDWHLYSDPGIAPSLTCP